MKELELTSNAALTDAVYETALNGSFLEVKLVAGSVGDDEPRGMQPEYECYHISYPDKKTQFCSSNLWMLPKTK